MADEVTIRVVDALKPEFEQLRGELRAAKRDLSADIDAISARMNADKLSIDEQLMGLRQDLNWHTTMTKSVLDGDAARFRTMDAKLDELSDKSRSVIDRLC